VKENAQPIDLASHRRRGLDWQQVCQDRYPLQTAMSQICVLFLILYVTSGVRRGAKLNERCDIMPGNDGAGGGGSGASKPSDYPTKPKPAPKPKPKPKPSGGGPKP